MPKIKNVVLSDVMSCNITECLSIGMKWEEMDVDPRLQSIYISQLVKELAPTKTTKMEKRLYTPQTRNKCICQVLISIGAKIITTPHKGRHIAILEGYVSYNTRYKEMRKQASAPTKDEAMRKLIEKLKGTIIYRKGQHSMYLLPKSIRRCGSCEYCNI